MNQFTFSKFLVATTVVASIAILAAPPNNYAYDWWPFGEKTDRSAVPVVIDDTPLSAERKATTSIAPMIKKISPSVVNVYSSKVVRSQNQLEHMPFFNDPFFRHFFGDRLESSPQWKPKSRKEQSLGSGVIVSGDGYILTNNHVVDGADEVKIALADSKKEFIAQVIGTDPKTDIALLKVDGKDLPAATLADSDIIEVGDFVVAIGNPFGVGQTVTSGIVSAIGRGNIGITDYEDFIQTDASINPGNSGGALVDADGRLIGINTAILSRTGGNQGIGFAVPVNLVKSVMERLLKHGRVVRGFLGVVIQEITPDLAAAFDIDVDEGAIVSEVTPESAAEAAGMEKGDVIVEFDGKAVKDVRHLRLMVARTAPDSEVSVEVIRDRQRKPLTAVLKELPGTELAGSFDSGDDADDSGLLRGIAVDDLNANTRRQLGISADLDGAVVQDIESDAPAYEAGLREGDIILEINRTAVRNAAEAIKESRRVKGDSVLLYVWSKGGRRYIVVSESR